MNSGVTDDFLIAIITEGAQMGANIK